MENQMCQPTQMRERGQGLQGTIGERILVERE